MTGDAFFGSSINPGSSQLTTGRNGTYVQQSSRERFRSARKTSAERSVLETIRKTTPSEIARALVQVMAGQPTITSP